MSDISLENLAAELERLQAQIAELKSRITAHERPRVADADPGPAAGTAAGSVGPQPERAEELSPDVLLAISAAVAAYLGERAHIRAVRLISHPRWSQEGRVSIQASHYLSRG